MYDKLDLLIPFDTSFVQEFNSVREFDRAGMVDPALYDFGGVCELTWEAGQPVYSSPKAKKFDTISSSISGVAIGFFPNGNGFHEWPHVRIKASPSKILQGHNVFGTECLREGALQMMSSCSMAFPKIWAHLNHKQAEIRFLDCTYSARIDSPFFVDRIFKLFRGMASSRTNVNNNFKDYLKIGKNSEYNSQKIYLKHQEVIADLKDAERKRQLGKVKVLSDKRLQCWAHNLMRFEATIGHRRMETLGIPRRLDQFLKWHDWYEKAYHEPACRYLWRQNFQPFLKQLEGQTMSNVDDDGVKQRIHLIHDKTRLDGRRCTRRSNAVWKTFRDLKAEGYSQLLKESKATFLRNVKFLEECGFSRAYLKSFDPDRPNDNVVPMVQMINIDLSNQRPAWYVEPKAGFDDKVRLIRVA